MNLIELSWFLLCAFVGSVVAMFLGYDILGQWIGAGIGLGCGFGVFFWYYHWRNP